MAEIMVIDGKDKVLGRVASSTAKLLLKGNKVALVNAEKMFLTGHVRDIVAKYKQRVNLQDKANPEHSPYWSRRPDLFVKRVVRGMLPYKQPKGKTAFRLLKVYIGVPEELKNEKPIEINTKKPHEIFEKIMRVEELSKKLGYNKM